MHSLFSELRILWDDVLALIRSPSKLKSFLHIPLYSNAIYLILANLANALFGFVFWIIAARLYTAEAVGVASAILSAASLLTMLSSLGLGYGLIRFLKSSNNPANLINSSFTLTGLLSLAAAGIYIIGLGVWSPGLHIIRENPLFLVVFLGFTAVSVLTGLMDQAMMAERKAGFIFIRSLIFNILRLSLPVLLAVFSQSFGIFGSWSAATFVALLVCLFLLLPRAQPGYHPFFKIDRKAISEVLHFSFFNYLSDLFWFIPGLVLPIIIVNRSGAENNAYFYIAWTMSGILTMIPAAITTSLFAEGANDETQLKNHVRRSLKMVALLLIPAVILVWFLGHMFLHLFGGLYAENSATLLRWLAIASLPLAINLFYFNIKRVQRKMKTVIFLNALMAIIVVLTSYLLLPRLGINGVGVAWLAGQSAVAVIVIAWDMRKWV
jgi:Membrane protein involved in the export of O-antigen and teichoic acid